jgi:hypothetical protein
MSELLKIETYPDLAAQRAADECSPEGKVN